MILEAFLHCKRYRIWSVVVALEALLHRRRYCTGGVTAGGVIFSRTRDLHGGLEHCIPSNVIGLQSEELTESTVFLVPIPMTAVDASMI